MKRIDVVKRGEVWQGRDRFGRVVASAATKVATVRLVAAWARKSPVAVTVKIHLVNGRIAEERTYPRAADPRRSPG